MQAADLFDFELWVACPKQYSPAKEDNLKNVVITDSVSEAVKDSDLISTDVWVSMGDEKEKSTRIQAFKDYQVNEAVLAEAKSDVIF